MKTLIQLITFLTVFSFSSNAQEFSILGNWCALDEDQNDCQYEMRFYDGGKLEFFVDDVLQQTISAYRWTMIDRNGNMAVYLQEFDEVLDETTEETVSMLVNEIPILVRVREAEGSQPNELEMDFDLEDNERIIKIIESGKILYGEDSKRMIQVG